MSQFLNIEYLKRGNPKQKKVYQILKNFSIWKILQDFQPLLVGTIPLGIDTPQSDIDIICAVQDLEYFQKIILDNFSTYPHYQDYPSKAQNQDAWIVQFQIQEFPIEIFAQACPSPQQWGFRHLLIEYQLLKIGGFAFHKKVKKLKHQGWKTEPAFAHLLGLEGDPYQALIHLESLNLQELAQLIEKH